MPDPGSAPDPARVEFSTALRGYDKAEVDTFIRTLAEEHNDLVAELNAARRTAERAHLGLGEEMGELLQHAKDVAEGLVKRAEEEAALTTEAARRNAERTISDARRAAEELTRATEAAAATLVRNAEQKVARLEELENEVRARLAALQQSARVVDEQIQRATARPAVGESAKNPGPTAP